MPKEMERKLKVAAREKFHSITSPQARAYIYGTMRSTGWTPSREKKGRGK